MFRDDLLWRSGVYSTATKARQALATQGHTLGIDDPGSDVRPALAEPGATQHPAPPNH